MKITFSGDIAFSNYFKHRNINNVIDQKIDEFLKCNDYNIFNIEGALTKHNTIKTKGGSHKSDPKCISTLRKMNCNVFNLGNNHIMDCGKKGLEETLRLANDNNIRTIGAGINIDKASDPLFLYDGKITVSVISISHPEGILATKGSEGVFSDKNHYLIKKKINEMKDNSDWVIVNYHGGEEFTLTPNPNRRKKFLNYLDYGADIIVSHHAHVTQGYERIKGKYIFYSLGNFIFDTDIQRGRLGTDVGLLVKFIFNKDEIQVETLFTKIDRERNKVISNDEAIIHEINVKTLKENWCKEAHRIIFVDKRMRDLSTNNSGRHAEILQYNKVKIIKKIFKKLLNIIKYSNVRDIYVGAMKYYIKTKFKLVE